GSGPAMLSRTPLPAAAPGTAVEPLGGCLAGVLALLELALQEAHQEEEDRDDDDQPEAEVGHDLVVGRAVEAAAVVLRERRRGGDEQQQHGVGQGDRPELAHRRESYRSARRAGLPAAPTISTRGPADRLRHAQGHRGGTPPDGGLLQTRAPRTDDDRWPQRRRQDDAPEDARGGDLDRPGGAVGREGSADRPPRPAPAAGARDRPARLPALGLRGGACDRGRAVRSGGPHGRWGDRRVDARPLLGRPGAPGGPRGVSVALSRDEHGARPRLPRRGPRPLPRHLLRRPADAGLAG